MTAPRRRLGLLSWRFIGVARWLFLPMGACGTWVSASTSCTGLPDAPQCLPCKHVCPDDLRCDAVLLRCVPKDDPNACDEVHTLNTGGYGGTLGGVSGGGGEPDGSEGGVGVSGRGASGDATSGRAGASGASGTEGDPEECNENSPVCRVHILTERRLDAVCRGTDAPIHFEARCACDPSGTLREMTWKLNGSTTGLELSEDGELSVSVPDGVYHFDVEVLIANQYHASDKFTLTVQNRCWLLFMTDDAAEDAVRVAAVRLDREDDPILLPRSGEGGTVTNFAISQDGRFVTQSLATESGTRLELVELGQSDVNAKTLDYDGGYVAHAFSSDSRWLAIVTTDDDDADQESLQLFDLTDGVSLVDSKSIAYGSHLTWSDAEDILYMGQATVIPNSTLAAQEHTVTDSELRERREQPGTKLLVGQSFHGFLVGDSGYLCLYNDAITYVDRMQSQWFGQPQAVAISPNLKWSIHSHTSGMRVDALAQAYDLGEPFSTAIECEFVRTFSGDGSRFLCTRDQRFFVYETRETRGTLSRTELDIPGGFQSTIVRMAFSERGNWLALVPNKDGLVLAAATSTATEVFDTPVLGKPDGTDEWDFVFSSDEKWLIVQQGRALWVAALTEGDRPSFLPVEGDFSLPAVPECSYDWFPDPNAWCGASRFRGNLVLSRTGRHVAFGDASGVVRAVDLDTRRVTRGDRFAESCQARSKDCLQFQ